MDAHLLPLAGQGDEAALTAIYEQCHPRVYRYIYFRVRNEPLAEELAADVFVRMVDRIDTFKDRGRPVLAWLYAIARNLVIDHQRRAGRLICSPLFDDLQAGVEAHPALIADSRLTIAELSAALDQLTEIQRQVILLKFIEGLSNTEVAAIVGKDEGAVKSLQHRALGALRRTLCVTVLERDIRTDRTLPETAESSENGTPVAHIEVEK